MRRAILVLALLAGGCVDGAYYSAVVTEAVRKFNDEEAKTLMLGPCVMRLGAYFRLDEATRETVKTYAKARCP